MSRIITPLATAAILLISPAALQAAGFSIDATRLIYPEGETSITATLRNSGTESPYLIQAAVSRVSSKTETAPFQVIPPLFRLNANSKHQIRILFKGAPLPADRESVFYFRAAAIPASTPGEQDENSVRVKGAAQFGVGKSIKLFYRPKGLTGSPLDAQRQLAFTRSAAGLTVTNASAYYVSFASLEAGKTRLPLVDDKAKMLAPGATYTWKATGLQGEVKWKTIDDHGGYHAFTQKLP